MTNVAALAAALEHQFGQDRVQRDVPLAAFTTMKVGGPAEVLIETQGADDIAAAVKLAHSHGVTVTMLGGGSNVLVAAHGIRGLVIRTRGGAVSTIGDRLVRADAAVTINGQNATTATTEARPLRLATVLPLVDAVYATSICCQYMLVA